MSRPSPSKQAGITRHGHTHSTAFTPRPYQIELVEHALKKNTITCLNSAAGKSFVWMTYLHEIMGQNFRVLHSDGLETNAIILFASDVIVKDCGSVLKNHMDLTVAVVTTEHGQSMTSSDWEVTCQQSRVIVTCPVVFSNAVTNSMFDCQRIGVLILDECHTVLEPDGHLAKIMKAVDDAEVRPYILGLTSSLLKEDSSAMQLEKDIKTMEQLLHCKAETATDLIALDGCAPTQPDEKIVLCGTKSSSTEAPDENKKKNPKNPADLSSEIRDILLPAISWLRICNITSASVFAKVPPDMDTSKKLTNGATLDAEDNDEDSDNTDGSSVFFDKEDHLVEQEKAASESSEKTIDQADVDAFLKMSLTVLSQIVLVLDVLGLWCAHKLVILLLKQLQKTLNNQESFSRCKDMTSKWKYFLLRYTDSHLRTVYTLCQTHIRSQKKVDMKLVTPKVNRLLQVLKEYKPPADSEKKSENQKMSKYNDRSEAGYVSWWQDSDAEEDDEETLMLIEGNKKNYETWSKKDGSDPESKPIPGKAARPFHHANSLCGIVFVKEKYVAMMLQRLLKEVSKEDSELWHVASAHISSLVSSGHNPNELERNEVPQDIYSTATNAEKQKQEEALRNFRSHEVNLLVSTNCLEEYAEIPKCNLVLRFDVPSTYKSYILSKSRARSNNSTYMMLVDECEKAEFMMRLQEYKKIEKVLQDSVYDNLVSKGPPADFDYLDVKEDDSDDEYELAKVPPYYSSPNTCVTIDSAIHIINRYCSRLPSDPFTHLGPRCEVFEVSGDNEALAGDDSRPNPSYKCSLQLPINSHVRNPIMGIPMSTVLLAQKAVALEACKVLHESGELDDHFMPIGKEMVKYAEELDPWPDEKSQVPGRPGTTKRRQTYEKEIPQTLSDCLPRPNVPLFLYKIKMKLRARMPDRLNVRRRKLHAPEETTRCFGILTSKALPPTLGFPIFTRSGEESVHIRLCRSFISLGEHHIKMIRSFHYYIFSDMLRIDRVPLAFKPDGAPMQILVVFLNKSSRCTGLDIDWKFMCEVAAKRRVEERKRTDPWFRHRMQEAKGGKNVFVFKRSKYEDGVVVAKYRSPDQPNRFYVAEIKDDLDPYSNFPSSEYESFHNYYRIKYGLDISCLNQPLLDVDHTSSRLNLLTPRYMNQKGKALPISNLEKKRAKYETLTNRQILVPELCDLHPIPASLWRKAVCIPSVLYRLSAILVAEELRQKIFEDSKIGQGTLPMGQQWPDLTFGWENTILNANGKVNNFFNRTENHCSGSTITIQDRKVDIESNGDSVEQEASINISSSSSEVDAGCESLPLSDVSLDHIENGSKPPGGVESPNLTDSNNGNGELVEKSDGTSTACDEISKELPAKEDLHSSDSELASDYDSDEYLKVFNLSEDDDKKHPPRRKKIRDRKMDEFMTNLSRFSIIEIPKKALQPAAQHGCTGPSPGLILQALTLSNASDGFNLERLEMLGDSFLKHAVTVYLFCTYPDAHEGKLSYMRSKKVSNYNLYRIGQQKNLPGKMTALIFDPAVNWLPPGYVIGTGSIASEDGEDILKNSRHDSLEDEMEIGVWTGVPGRKIISPKQDKDAGKKSPAANVKPIPDPILPPISHVSEDEEEEGEDEIFDEDEIQMIDNMLGGCVVGGLNGMRGSSHSGDRRQNGFSTFTARSMQFVDRSALQKTKQPTEGTKDTEFVIDTWTPVDADGKPLCASDPLLIDLHTQHSLADKSIADCVEAILGAYLTTCGHRAAQLLLCYFGLKVLPKQTKEKLRPGMLPTYGFLKQPTYVLFDESHQGYKKLGLFAKDLESFEKKIGYTFKNKSYLLQAFTHASYYLNTITDCYQRLEFLGDAILDFLITCRLFNDPSRRHSPGALTDLRSALVNNTIFASLAVRHDFHKYFKAISPELHHIIDGFVRYQHLQDDAQGMDAQLAKRYYATTDTRNGADDLEVEIVPPGALADPEDLEEEEEEDVEVPKALGDIFESVAGAIYMDSGMDLDEVWRVYQPMMSPLIEKFSSCVPRAPVRELLEMEPETAKFSWAEKRCDGKVRVTVEVIGKGSFKGVGRSYRIAKSAAARRALRFLKSELNDD